MCSSSGLRAALERGEGTSHAGQRRSADVARRSDTEGPQQADSPRPASPPGAAPAAPTPPEQRQGEPRSRSAATAVPAAAGAAAGQGGPARDSPPSALLPSPPRAYERRASPRPDCASRCASVALKRTCLIEAHTIGRLAGCQIANVATSVLLIPFWEILKTGTAVSLPPSGPPPGLPAAWKPARALAAPAAPSSCPRHECRTAGCSGPCRLLEAILQGT